jgi:protocatechuate 3,4-dioxygenase beta subunit
VKNKRDNRATPGHDRTIDRGRRRALLGLTACAGALSASETLAQAAACVVTANAGEGPFYFDPMLMRADVTETAPGAPLDIAVQVASSGDCGSLAAARVDLWQADALGLYSGYRDQPGVGGISTEPAVDQTFLRGTQFTDADGWVRFRTVYPSWYGGRTPHIHFKVILGDEEVVASQIFFPDEVTAEVFSRWEPYRSHVSKRTTYNNNDPLIEATGSGGVNGVFCEIGRFDERGLEASAVIVVDGA